MNYMIHARTMRGYLYLLFEVILCVILIFFLASMFFAVNSRDRTLAKKLRFNQQVARAKTQNKASAVKWVALVTCVFLSSYGIILYSLADTATGQVARESSRPKLCPPKPESC